MTAVSPPWLCEMASCAGLGSSRTAGASAALLMWPLPKTLKAASGAQVCTGVMLHGYPLVKSLCGGLQVLPGMRTLWRLLRTMLFVVAAGS